MDAAQLLVFYGYLVILVMAGFILVPYLRGKRDLFSGWNVLLLGIAIYTGVGCLAAVYLEFYWEEVQFTLTRDLVNWYVTYSLVFLVVLLFSYHYIPISVPLASRSLQKWPALSFPLVLYVVLLSLVLMVAGLILGNRTGFAGSVTSQLAFKSVTFSTVFSFALWYQNKANVATLALFLGVFAVASLYAMFVFLGRRMLLSVVLAPVAYVYWSTLRNWKPKSILLLMGAATFAIFLVGTAYGTFRHFSIHGEREQRTVSNILEQVRQVDVVRLIQSSVGQVMALPQQNVEYSMLVRRSVERGDLEPKPLNTLMFIASYPIPRVYWAGKPRTVGDVLPRDVLLTSRGKSPNWGTGPPGHGAYEGGLPVLVLYAILATFGIRFLDEPLKRQPSNPFLISILAAAAPYILGWPRGGFENMTLKTIECFIFAILLGFGGRFLFGIDRNPASYSTNVSPRANSHGRLNR